MIVAWFLIVFNGQVTTQQVAFRDQASCRAAVTLVQTALKSDTRFSVFGTCLNNAVIDFHFGNR